MYGICNVVGASIPRNTDSGTYIHVGPEIGVASTKAFGLKETSRIKAFVFSFISVPAKWIMTARQYVLNIYTENRAYARPFKTGFG